MSAALKCIKDRDEDERLIDRAWRSWRAVMPAAKR